MRIKGANPVRVSGWHPIGTTGLKIRESVVQLVMGYDKIRTPLISSYLRRVNFVRLPNPETLTSPITVR